MLHGFGSCLELLGLDEPPGTRVSARELAGVVGRVVVLGDTANEVVGLPDVAFAGRVADEHIHVIRHGFPMKNRRLADRGFRRPSG